MFVPCKVQQSIHATKVEHLNGSNNVESNQTFLQPTANGYNIEIKHGFPCINICQVPREVLKVEVEDGGFQLFPRDREHVNAL